MEPLYMVASQFQTLMAEGMATVMVRKEKMVPSMVDWPLGNMWCPHTRKPSTAISRLDAAMNE